MTLTQQFIVVSILPLSFLIMVFYLWRSDVRRRQVRGRWMVTLMLAAVWASSILRYFGGETAVGGQIFSNALVFSWGIVGSYAFSLTTLGVLITTFSHINTPLVHNRIALILGGVLWLLALILEPRLWPYDIPNLLIAGQPVGHFDIWAAVWITSWLMPLVAAIVLTQRINVELPNSLFRNQVHYWLLLLILFMIGGALASVSQPGQPGWQQAGVVVVLLAAILGTISITKSHLPNLQLGVRQLMSRLSGTLIIFALTWGALSFLVEQISDLPPQSENLIVLLAAALFAGLFTLLYRFVNDVTRRIFLPALARREMVMADYTNVIGNLPEPTQLAHLFLRIVQSNLNAEDVWLFTAHDGPQGRLILRPLAAIGAAVDEVIDFPHDSPVAEFLRGQKRPLIQYDIDTLETFAAIPDETRAVLARWQRVLYMSLYAGKSLVGVVALGVKATGEAYERQEFDLLQALCEQFSPLLAQARNMASLRRINDFVFQQNQVLLRERQHLRELANLYAQFIRLVSPDLRQPFTTINQQIEQLQQSSGDEQKGMVEAISRQLSTVKTPIDNLITMAARIQTRDDFNFSLIHIEDVVANAMRGLRTMADARRVTVEFNQQTALPAVLGDAEQMQEAVQHLLHNAIKFNKIGGVVQIECGIEGSELYLRLVDTGVGIPEERLAQLWTGFQQIHKNGSSRGSGLGLALARFIVAAHGGRVDAQSKYGSGSVFSIYLPLVFEE